MADSAGGNLTSRLEQGVLVLSVTQTHLRSTDFDVVDVLRTQMLEAVQKAGAARVVVDLSAVDQFGSAGFRPLLSLRRHLHEKNGQLLLCGLHPDVREVFLITRLIDTEGSSAAPFGVAADAKSAVARLTAS
jgi:anti-anti-sigma factor